MSQSFLRTFLRLYCGSRIAIGKYPALAMFKRLIHDRHAVIEAAKPCAIAATQRKYYRKPWDPCFPLGSDQAAIHDFSRPFDGGRRLDTPFNLNKVRKKIAKRNSQ
jgi:hypothetical protein